MPATSSMINGHRRASSSSTVRAAPVLKNGVAPADASTASILAHADLWIHDDSFSSENILINPSILGNLHIKEGELVEVTPQIENSDVLDFEESGSKSTDENKLDAAQDQKHLFEHMRCLCIAKFATPELLVKHQGLEVSVTKTIAEAFGLRPRSRVILKPTGLEQWTASHIELTFRDAYLARSDMWRLVSNELAGKVVYRGQKISFLGTMRLTVKDVHVKGHKVSTGFFGATTVPVFRSEAARYVLFIQMSQEMWDFDSEGNGEIMFNRVVNGFLPDLFRRWVQLEVRHLVSIVMFGRLEYDRYDFGDLNTTTIAENFPQSSAFPNTSPESHQDFFRVVVTDMASAQWTTILNELKKDFQVFLRDITLHKHGSTTATSPDDNIPKITGRPSTALKGNILEAINLASSQFANDYIDRDLIRTGVSTVIITAGTGVFDVDRDLLNLTSENLTNNGIGIDIVCLSNMPLHSVPLFRYRLPQSSALSRIDSNLSIDSNPLGTSLPGQRSANLDQSSALSSFTGASVNYFSRFPSAFPSKFSQIYGHGIPHWIDLSYWSQSLNSTSQHTRKKIAGSQGHHFSTNATSFVPRVRMYELQMMGVMELGMADISIPYLAETMVQTKRPRRKTSAEFSRLKPKGDLSQSPSYFRKASALTNRPQDSIGILAQKVTQTNIALNNMDDYDGSVFLDVNRPKGETRIKPKRLRTKIPAKVEPPSQSENPVSSKSLGVTEPDHQRLIKSPSRSQVKSPVDDVTKESKTRPPANPPRISRSISYALRGLSTPLRYIGTAETNVDVIKAPPSAAKTSLMQANAATPSTIRTGMTSNIDTQEVDARSVLSNDSATESTTRPISITGTGNRPVSQQVSHKLEMPLRTKPYESHGTERQQNIRPGSPSPSSEDEAANEVNSLDLISRSVPQSTLPFIRNVNASNPLKRQSKAESLFGRWQHLYPHKPRASTVKWRSLCTPASVPLTTEGFPTAQELASNYDKKEHRVQVRQYHESSEKPSTLDSLLFEMIAIRLSHGYQVVVGDAVRKVIGSTLCEVSVFLDPMRLSRWGDTLLMSMGNTIQKLSFADPESIHVTRYVKKEIEVDCPFAQQCSYNPNIRTILAKDYWYRSMVIRGFSEEYPWETADNYLADGETDSGNKVKKLRFWRARFVLLPVDPPSNAWRPQQNTSTEENEEEIHLLGIRALTQMWQKARYIDPSERRVGPGRLSSIRRRDMNPLEIKFETLNPSDLVATELDKLLSLEEAGEASSTQLLPDSERLDRDTSMAKIAHAIQGEKGIEIKNRRWHLRLHYNCFHGEEFTNWLSHNVRTIETREEAVEFGNQLMKEGLFEHVNGRHNFKDGNYFYSLKPDFRMPRVDPKSSWLPTRRSDKSIPPTPLSEHPVREGLQITTRSRSGSSLAYSQFNPATPLDSARGVFDKRKKTVTLTKMIKIDVDTRKRSSRPEIVNLYYDRFHHPENCYHIELSWLNTTSKLVDDAIVSWTNQAEKYGLKLVEVPIAEACRIPDSEPFRRAYRIKLVLEPPKRQAVNHILTSHSFAPQPSSNNEKDIYQKAILRRFNFVLDLEGSSEFPDNVDIQYSNAGLEYKHTQFVHRSGVILAQVTDEGDFLLLANRLYNSRFVNSKEANNAKFDSKREPTLGPGISHRPPVPSLNNAGVSLQPSGIIALNMQSPRVPLVSSPSPMARATADVLGSRSAMSSSSIAQYVTPEQIKDDLEQFCNDRSKLEQFYKDVSLASSSPQSGNPCVPRRSTGGTGSNILQPIHDANESITELVLPEAVTSPAVPSSSGFSLGLGGLMSRRARPSIAYESVAEMFGRGGGISVSTADRLDTSNGFPFPSSNSSRHNSGDVSGRTSGDISGNLELRVRVDTPGGTSRIEERIEVGMMDSIGSPKAQPRKSS